MSQWQADPGAGLDSGLSPLGLVQAEHLAKWAGTRPRLGPGQRFEPDRMFVSPLRRARQTAGEYFPIPHAEVRQKLGVRGIGAVRPTA